MNSIKTIFYEGERPLYASRNLTIENVKFYPGESPIKESKNIKVIECEFMAKYPFWHCQNISIKNSHFSVYSRAAIWYTQQIELLNCLIDAPKMFRSVSGLIIKDTKMNNSAECFWNCDTIDLQRIEMSGADYVFMNCHNIHAENFNLQGNYSFQDAVNVEIHDSNFDSKDAFWNTKNVTVYNSVLDGEYLGWYSENLRLVNCTISGAQPLCYAKNLVLENCTMRNTDLAFEYSTVRADINGHIDSIKNPLAGYIRADSIGEVIFDEHARNVGGCEVIIAGKSK
jgi:hypothetical protein